MATIKRGPAKPAIPAKPRTYQVVWPGGTATTKTYGEAIVVLNAISRVFTRVVVLDQDSEVVSTYDNR